MKNLTLILLCLCLTGCISSTVTRGVNTRENIYYSSTPNIQLQVPAWYTYHKGGPGKMDHEFYHNGLSIYIHLRKRPSRKNPNAFWLNPEKWMFNNVPMSEKLTQGALTVLDKKWYYCNSLGKEGNGSYFTRNLGHFSPEHDTLYVRFVKKLSYDESQALWDHEYLTSKQHEFIKDMVKSLEGEIKITNFVQKPTIEDKLTLLKQSYEANLITKEEYITKKKELLDAL